MIGELLGGRGGIATPTTQSGDVPPSLGNTTTPISGRKSPSRTSNSKRNTPHFTKRPPKPAPPSKNTSRFGFPK